jgi:hypothetical protein
MSYVSAVAIFVFILSPLLVPLTVSGVHANTKWRRNSRTARKINDQKSSATTPIVSGMNRAGTPGNLEPWKGWGREVQATVVEAV